MQDQCSVAHLLSTKNGALTQPEYVWKVWNCRLIFYSRKGKERKEKHCLLRIALNIAEAMSPSSVSLDVNMLQVEAVVIKASCWRTFIIWSYCWKQSVDTINYYFQTNSFIRNRVKVVKIDQLLLGEKTTTARLISISSYKRRKMMLESWGILNWKIKWTQNVWVLCSQR